MVLYQAEITDIIRSSQRDNEFINELQEYITPILNILTGRKYAHLKKYKSSFANGLYYTLTTVSDLQTLGEEYTGTIRINNQNDIPSNFSQILWLSLYIGGEALYDRMLMRFSKNIQFSKSMTTEARIFLLKIIDFLKDNKYILTRIHHSIFYINGTYNNISNRVARIKYVLLQQWIQDTGATRSFKLLGQISLFYLIIALTQKILAQRHSKSTHIIGDMRQLDTVSAKICVLCAENRRNTCATPCGHLFCWDCIQDSLQYQQICPVCRETVYPSRIVILQNYA